MVQSQPEGGENFFCLPGEYDEINVGIYLSDLLCWSSTLRWIQRGLGVSCDQQIRASQHQDGRERSQPTKWRLEGSSMAASSCVIRLQLQDKSFPPFWQQRLMERKRDKVNSGLGTKLRQRGREVAKTKKRQNNNHNLKKKWLGREWHGSIS